MARIGDDTRIRVDFGEHPEPPYVDLRDGDGAISVYCEQVDDGRVVWRRRPREPVALGPGDEFVEIVGPRAIDVVFGPGVPSEPGEFELVGELRFDGDAILWPHEPRRIVFEE